MSSKFKLAIVLLISIVFFLFWGITKTFYQQDEWHGMGDILSLGVNSISLTNSGIIDLLLGGSRILSNSLVYFFYSRFPFNVLPISLFILVFHAINSVLVFVLCYKFTKKVAPAFLGSLFFVVNAVSSGSIVWPASGIATLPATFFILISLITFFEFLKQEKSRWLILSFLSLYVSLFFKETAAPLFFLLPISSLLFVRYSLKEFTKTFWPFFTLFFILVGLRFIQFQNISTSQDLFLTGASKNIPLALLTRSFLYPVTSFSLIYIPSELILPIVKQLTWIYYPFFPPELYDLVAQTTVLDMVSVLFSSVILFFLFVLFRSSTRQTKNMVIFVIGFILLSFLPYIIISKSYSYLESRYYYVSAIGAGLLISLISVRALQVFGKRTIIFLFLILIYFFALHVKIVKSQIEQQIQFSQERINILSSITNVKPDLTHKNIFYITGDRTYYITGGNYIPMQQGMGNTLLVWYMGNGSAPKQFLKLISEYYLWELVGGQGYKEVDNYGFGYFWDIDKLEKVVKENKLTKTDIVAFFYNSKEQKIINITDNIVSKIFENEKK